MAERRIKLGNHILRIVTLAITGIVCIALAQKDPPPVPLPDDLVEVQGRLNSDGDWTDGRCSFTLENVPAHLYLACEHLDPRAQQSFRWGMRPGTAITAHVHRNDSSQLIEETNWVEVRGLIADRDTLLDKDQALKDAAQRANTSTAAYFWYGLISLVVAAVYAGIIVYLDRKSKR